MQALTGNPHLDGRIIAKIDTRALKSLVEFNAYIQRLSQSSEFWFAKVEIELGEAVLKLKPVNVTAQDFYAVHNYIRKRGADAALGVAAKNGTIHGVKIVLQAGANVNAADKYGDTALALAVKGGYLAVVKELILQGANVNVAAEGSTTALMYAALSDNSEVMQELIRAGANVNATGMNETTPLIYAASEGDLEIVQKLIQAGANVNAVNEYRNTALTSAARSGYSEVVKELLAHGADVNAARGYAPLMRDVLKYGHTEIANILQHHNAQ